MQFRHIPAFPGKDRGMIIACREGRTATHRHHDHRRAERHQALVELAAAHLACGQLLYDIFFFQILHRCCSSLMFSKCMFSKLSKFSQITVVTVTAQNSL